MKIQIRRNPFFRILHMAKEVSESSYMNSYYSYFIFTAKDDSITIKSASRQATFEQTLYSNKKNDIKVEGEASFLILGARIFYIVDSLHDGLITLILDGTNLTVVEEDQNSNIEFKVRTKDIEDFPKDIHKNLEKDFLCVKKEAFFEIINNTHFAVSSNVKDTSMFLTGVYFDIEDNMLSAVATDRNRMSISKIKVDGISQLKEDVDSDIIVPAKFILFLKHMLQKFSGNQDIFIAIDNDRIFFKVEQIIVSANLISGKYYDYKRIIPQGERSKFTVNVQKLIDVINRISAIVENKSETSVLMTMKNNNLSVSIEEKENSSAEDTIEVGGEGNEGSFLIKALFLLQPLGIVKGEEVTIEYGDSVRDLIKITSETEKDTLHIAAQLSK